MARQVGQQDVEMCLIQQYLDGDAAILARLREEHHSTLRSWLMARGATETEAEDLLADLWGDCVPGGDERPSLLEKFSGRCALRTWLATVATNRLYDLKRRQRFQAATTDGAPQDEPVHSGEPHLHPSERLHESSLVDLLRCSLEWAFGQCRAEDLLMLRLVYLHEVTQREVSRMWGWSEAKVSRNLAQALHEIEARTLRRVQAADPWMELSWQDFVELCEAQQVGFV